MQSHVKTLYNLNYFLIFWVLRYIKITQNRQSSKQGLLYNDKCNLVSLSKKTHNHLQKHVETRRNDNGCLRLWFFKPRQFCQLTFWSYEKGLQVPMSKVKNVKGQETGVWDLNHLSNQYLQNLRDDGLCLVNL